MNYYCFMDLDEAQVWLDHRFERESGFVESKVNVGPFKRLMLDAMAGDARPEEGELTWMTVGGVDVHDLIGNSAEDMPEVLAKLSADVDEVRKKMTDVGYDMMFDGFDRSVFMYASKTILLDQLMHEVESVEQMFQGYKGPWTEEYHPVDEPETVES